MSPLLIFALLTVAGRVNQPRQEIIDFLLAERDALREKLGPKRLRFTEAERIRLANKGQLLGRKLLRAIGQLVTPETILRWYRQLVAQKYDGSKNRKPSQGNDNPEESPGVPDTPRESAWVSFQKDHEDVMAAADFFTVEVVTWYGLVRYFVFFVMEVKTRTVHIAGITHSPTESWMLQIARNLSDAFDGFLLGKKHIILDRDPLYTPAFRNFLETSGVKPVLLPPRSPNLNPHAERFVLSVRTGCLDCIIPLGENHLRRSLEQYIQHYHAERPHQGLGNCIISPDKTAYRADGDVACYERLGGLLKYYHRVAE